MAYEGTEVQVSQSQEGIRKLIMARKGGRVAFITDLHREGFTTIVEIDGAPYQIRIFRVCREPQLKRQRAYRGSKEMTAKQIEAFQVSEERRIWRVLYYHVKTVFEAADSGVMEFRELMLPYIVTKSGQTISEQILPMLSQAVERNPARLLNA